MNRPGRHGHSAGTVGERPGDLFIVLLLKPGKEVGFKPGVNHNSRTSFRFSAIVSPAPDRIANAIALSNGKFPCAPFTTLPSGITRVWHIAQDSPPTSMAALHSDLKEDVYRPQPVRQVQIPKAGKPGEFRTLGIPMIYDRVCQQALLNRLEPIFEPAPVYHEQGAAAVASAWQRRSHYR